jgi:hypothetical protein
MIDILSTTTAVNNLIKSSSYKKMLYRHLLLECTHNLNVLRLMKPGAGQYNKSYLSLCKNLETDKIEMFISNKHLSDSIFTKIKDAVNKNDEEVLSNDILENMLLKIKALKVISELDRNPDMKKFRLKMRVQNLEQKLLKLKKHLIENNI